MAHRSLKSPAVPQCLGSSLQFFPLFRPPPSPTRDWEAAARILRTGSCSSAVHSRVARELWVRSAEHRGEAGSTHSWSTEPELTWDALAGTRGAVWERAICLSGSQQSALAATVLCLLSVPRQEASLCYSVSQCWCFTFPQLWALLYSCHSAAAFPSRTPLLSPGTCLIREPGLFLPLGFLM